MIFYNGTTGSLGRYFADAAREAGQIVFPLKSRLEAFDRFQEEITPTLKTLRSERPSESAILIHFAAKVSVPWCETHPEETRKTNVQDTVRATRIFIEACLENGIKPQILYVSSAHLYARNEGKIHETDPVLPRSVYARTKLEAEVLLRTLPESTGTDLRIARVFGLVAPEQPEFYILHAMLKRAREKRLKEIPGLSNLRDYLDSRDVCRALIKTLNAPHDTFLRVCPDRILNIAAGSGISIQNLVATCVREMYSETDTHILLSEMTEAPPRADDVPRIVASVDRYLSLFGENPRSISIEQTVRDALAFKV